MESEMGTIVDGLVPHGGELAITIPILEGSKGSDAGNGMQGGNPKYFPTAESGAYSASNAVPDKTSNGKSTSSETLRRRHISTKTTESERQIRSLSMKKSKRFSQTKSRVLEVEQSDPTGPDAVFESYEVKNTSSHAREALSQKIKSMRAGALAPSEGRDEDDCSSSDEKDDNNEVEEEEEEKKREEQKGDEKNGEPRKFRKAGKKLKATDVVIEWILFICAMVVLVASLYADDLKTRAIWGLEIWKWCVLVAVIFCGRLVTKWAKDAIVLLIESKFLFNERVVYFLHGVKQSVRVAIWLALVLLAWVLLIDRRVERSEETVKVLKYITKALIASLIGAVMWMVKTLLVKFIAASFHVKTFFAKIREAISDEYVLWTLSVPPLKSEGGGRAQARSPFFCFKLPKWLSRRQKKKEGSIDQVENQQKVVQEKTSHAHQEENITLKKLGKMKPGKMPASTMGQLIDRIKSSKLSILSGALDENDLDDGGEQKDITSRSEAEVAASQIFKNVNKPGGDHIKEDDLEPFMNKENAECLVEWFQKVAEEGKISEASLSEWVVNIYKQREYLSHSLKDAKTAIEELNRVLSGVILVLIVLVWLLLMGFATTKVIFFLSSQLLLLGFVFSSTCRTLFEAMIFVFVMHPFDVGDRCVVDGVQMIVEEMDILKTAFLRYDNEMIYYPNAVLATKAISNYNRSPEKMGDAVHFDVDVSTSPATIEALKAGIKNYVDENSHDWHPDHSVQIKEIENMNKMKMVLFVNHKMNFQDFLLKMNRKTQLMLALKNIFEDTGMKYHLLPQEVHINNNGSAVPASRNLLD